MDAGLNNVGGKMEETNISAGKVKLLDRVENDFTYHKSPAGVTEHFVTIREKAKDLAKWIITLAPEGRELSTALTKLEEAVMHANAGISRQYPVEPVAKAS